VSRYLLRRLLEMVPVFFGVLLVVFVVSRLTPGDPARIILGEKATAEAVQELRQALGLDEPLPVQFVRYVGRALRGDLGRSIQSNERVTADLATRFPATVELTLAAMLIATAVGVATGVVAAMRQHSWFDGLSMAAALFGFSMPIFWLGIMLILLFAWQLGWFPISGRLDLAVDLQRVTNFYLLDALLTRNWAALADALRHLALPAATLSTVPLAIIARMTRSALLEVLRQDYIRTARAKGLGERLVIARHALRNAMIPPLTVLALQFSALLGGSVIIEQIFTLPGIGQYFFQAIFVKDFPVVQTLTLYTGVVVVLTILALDVAYAWLDPRIRYR
jgi:peptide/nickel transport system permease protein